MSTLSTTNIKNAGSTTNNIVLASDGTTTITSPSNIIKSGTAVASTSGTAIDFTGIPSWVKRITVMFSGVSLSGSTYMRVQLGTASGITSSGYSGVTSFANAAGSAGAGSFSAGFDTYADNAATVLRRGSLVLNNLSGNIWVGSGIICSDVSTFTMQIAGAVTLSGTLDRVRITSSNGTDTFDAGNINILYEG